MRFRAQAVVSLKDGLLDPQGKAVEGALPALGWDNVAAVRIGKYVELTVDAPDRAAAVQQVEEMCRRFLSNPVIEDFRVVAVEQAPAEAQAEVAG